MEIQERLSVIEKENQVTGRLIELEQPKKVLSPGKMTRVLDEAGSKIKGYQDAVDRAEGKSSVSPG